MSALTHGRAVALSVALIGGATITRQAINHEPAPAEVAEVATLENVAAPMEPHPLIRTASTWAPDRRCYVLWSDVGTLDDPSDDGWFYAWLDPGAAWTDGASAETCPAAVLAMAQPLTPDPRP